MKEAERNFIDKALFDFDDEIDHLSEVSEKYKAPDMPIAKF